MLKIITFIDDLFMASLRGKADRGNAEAQYKLGWAYYECNTGPENDKIAEKWFLSAAEQGHINAEYTLGDLYASHDSMRGVPKNKEKALEWYHRAAEHGHMVAQLELGLLYESGRLHALSVPKDYKEAVKWYHRAAEQGQIDAQFTLGKLYEDGEHVPQNHMEAYILFSLVANRSKYKIIIESAQVHRDSVAENLSPADLSEAEVEIARRISTFKILRNRKQ